MPTVEHCTPKCALFGFDKLLYYSLVQFEFAKSLIGTIESCPIIITLVLPSQPCISLVTSPCNHKAQTLN